MRRILSLVCALMLAAPAAAQLPTPNSQPTTQEIRQQLETIRLQLQAVIDRLPAGTSIPAGGSLEAALLAGGTINLPKAGAFTAANRFTIAKSGTVLNCNGSLLSGGTGPAVHIKPGTDDVQLVDCGYASAWPGAVLQCGDNDPNTQATAATVPKRIRIVNPTIATHRGKRGLELNCAAEVINPRIADVYADSLQDSQAINILNTCGPVSVLGGDLEAGSEVLLIGGDTPKVKDCPEGVVADVLLDDVTLGRRASWRTDGVKRAPKNTLEVKAGKRITVRNSRIGQSWRSTLAGDPTQDGSAIVITPRNGQRIAEVTFEKNVITDAAQGVQLMGRDVSTTPQTSGVVFRGNTWMIDGTTYNGRGVLALVVAGMGAVTWENETAIISGTSLFLVDSKEPVGPFTLTGSKMTTGRLVCAAPGVNFCGPTPADRAPFTLTATGNTFADAPSQFKVLYPSNVWITRAQLEQLVATPAK